MWRGHLIRGWGWQLTLDSLRLTLTYLTQRTRKRRSNSAAEKVVYTVTVLTNVPLFCTSLHSLLTRKGKQANILTFTARQPNVGNLKVHSPIAATTQCPAESSRPWQKMQNLCNKFSRFANSRLKHECKSSEEQVAIANTAANECKAALLSPASCTAQFPIHPHQRHIQDGC